MSREIHSIRLSFQNAQMVHMELDASHVPLSVLSQYVTSFQIHSIVQMGVLQVIKEQIAQQVYLAI